MLSPLTNCRLCPRQCGVNREAGKRGYCGAGAEVELYRYGPHYGEEPPVSGTRGSGTVFFSRCTMRCLYCQNHPWSQGGAGRIVRVEELAEVLESLAAAGCHNWNLVSPTPWLPRIREALGLAKRHGADLPVGYNTSGFESGDTLRALEGWVHVYLTDLRYARPESAQAGSGTPEYPAVARAAIKEMRRLAGPLRLDAEGRVASGVICRILILPGLAEEAAENLKWLAAEVGIEGVAVSVMAQYTPVHKAAGMTPWNRGISREEYDMVCKTTETLGFPMGWLQEYGMPPPEGLLGETMRPGRPA